MNRLPPFDTLIAFEATARLGGMTQAANELRVTQSAVSHRIRRLETFMGVPLFLRQSSGLSLTPAGQALLKGLADVLTDIADLKGQCVAATAPERLSIGVGSALADHWLVRRLPDFRRRHPEIAIELTIVENEAPERMADCDVRILWVDVSAAKASSTQRQLFQEHVFPVCHPSLVPAGHVPGDASLLLKLPLLHKRTPGYQSGEEWLWESWFSRLGLQEKPKEAFRFASIGPAISAALEGAGAVMARSMLVLDALADGRLIRLMPERYDQLSRKVHVVRWPARLCGDLRVLAFASWLTETAEMDRASTRENARLESIA